MNLFLIVRYRPIVKLYCIEKNFCFSKSLRLSNDDVQGITLCEYIYICLLIERVMYDDLYSLSFFFSLTMKYEKGIEPSSHCHLTFSSFSISSHLYSIQFILNDLMRSFRNGAIEHIEILFNHARDCDRVERNNRWKSSNYRQFVIVDDL
jgi:hypothetical protein